MTSAADTPVVGNEATKNLGQATDTLSPRQEFLRYSGFKWDVLAQPTAEQEYGFTDVNTLRIPEQTDTPPLERQTDDIPPVFARAYYVDPQYDDRRRGSVFDELRAPGHAFVYGKPGAGKSTLRLALETHLRAFPDATLAVTYEPGRAVEEAVAAALVAAEHEAEKNRALADKVARDAHLRILTAALAVDLFIQIVEQFGYRQTPPTEKQNRALSSLIRTADPRLKQVIDRLIRGKDAADLWGFAWLWRRLDRPVVQPVVRTLPLRNWLMSLSETLDQHAHDPEEPLPAPAVWQRALDTARLWGFEHVYIMVDGLDTYWRRPSEMLTLFDPLLQLLPSLAAQNVSLKAFLPLELRSSVTRRLPACGVTPDQTHVIDLEWTDRRLQAVLLARYRAAGSRRLSLNDLVEPALHDNIDELLIEAAAGSPRRLLLILHELVETHITRQPVQRPITSDELKEAIVRAAARMAV